MAELSSDLVPSRSAALELREERQIVREGYEFLDEKRLLLAAGMLRQLERYRELRAAFDAQQRQAAGAFAEAVARHGLHGITVYPGASLEQAGVETRETSFLGVVLVASRLRTMDTGPATPPADPSAEAARARAAMQELIAQAAVLAGVASNLFRLLAEYRRTERRARALEDVILPELEATLRQMQEQIEESEQEETQRSRPQFRNR